MPDRSPKPRTAPHKLRRAAVSIADLQQAGLVAEGPQPGLEAVAEGFRIRLTPDMAGAIAGGARDGIAAQFVPREEELVLRPEELFDPIGDKAHSPVAGLTHRYPDRVILHATQTCEVYCRFCFRREAVGEDGPLPADELAAAIAYVAATPAIHEVILTGGDPMVLSPRRLQALLAAIAAIPHVDVIRFHTRVPVVAPARIDAALIAALTAARRLGPAIYVVVHSNHPQELTEAACAALARLADAGVPLLSQSVLLRGINDDVAVLSALFRGLVRNRVTPYYLHHCDLARGTSHFRTTIAEGQALVAALRGHLSGICIPTYVLDIPGGHGKAVIAAGSIAPGAGPGQWRVTDWRGVTHDYADPERDRDRDAGAKADKADEDQPATD